MKLTAYLYLAICLLLVWNVPSEVKADMYLCKNDAGVMQFTNVPSMSNCKKLKQKSTRSRVMRSVSYGVDKDFYDSQIITAGSRFGVDPGLIKAVIHIESDFDRYAVSKKGAKGLMQLMPATAREMNVRDPFNPYQNIRGGTMYLRKLLDVFENDIVLALAAYNAGPTLVKKIKRVPKNPETMRYVKKVLRQYQKYGGDVKVSLKPGHVIGFNELNIASAR